MQGLNLRCFAASVKYRFRTSGQAMFPWLLTGLLFASAVSFPLSVYAGADYMFRHDENVLFQAETSLTLELTKKALFLGSTINASGKLSRDHVSTAELIGLPVILQVTAPDGTMATHSTVTSDLLGHYEFRNIAGFSQKGIYSLQAFFPGNSQLNASFSAPDSVLTVSVAGYAVIIEGKSSAALMNPSHSRTAKRIYSSLKRRGFTDSNIFYFGYDASQTGTDEVPAKARIQYALETWARQKMNASPAPLYVMMVGPAGQNAFYIDTETLTPSDLKTWLGSLEASLTAAAAGEKRIMIIGACHSGSFIPLVSGNGRIIIASAASGEVSYQGAREADSVSSSEFFIEELFIGLERGDSVFSSFESATKKTEIWTRQDSSKSGVKAPYFDHALQHPLIDDDGNGSGSNVISAVSGDGRESSDIYLGTGTVYDPDAPGNPADILDVTGTRFISSVSTSELLWAKVNDNARVSAAWVEIRPPSKVLQKLSGTTQAPVNNLRQTLALSSAAMLWQKQYSAFTESGKYEIFYFAADSETAEVTPVQRSVVYRNRAGNTAPSAFNLQSPPDGAVTPPMLQLSWGESRDSDGLTYTVTLSRDRTFQTVDHIIGELPRPSAIIGSDVRLEDFTTYFWKVSAVDYYGDMTSGGGLINNAGPQPAGEPWSFTTGSSNAMPGFISGYITDSGTGTGIPSATVTSSSSGSTATFSDGYYILAVAPGSMNISASKTGYRSSSSVPVSVTAGESVIRNFALGFIGTNLPSLGSVLPSPVATVHGMAQIFTAVYSDADGYANIKAVDLLVNPTLSALNGIRVQYEQSTGRLKLYNDAGSAPLATTCAPGEAGVTISNTQGTLNCQQSTVTRAGNNITVKWSITPAAGYASATAKKLYMRAVDKADNIAGWTQKGTWTVLSSNTAPVLGTLTPSNTSSAAGTSKSFTAVYTDANGYANLKHAELLATTAPSGGANSIWVRYDSVNGKLRMFDDAGTALLAASCSPGAAGASISNTQGTLNCGQTTVSKAGNNITVSWNITPAAGFSGATAKDVKMRATDYSVVTTGLVDKGNWTINAAP